MKQLLHEQTINGVVNKIHLSEPEIFADREAQKRSGHMGHALAELAPGKIIAFTMNTSAKRLGGHAAFGWMEYRISEDYGETFGEAQKFPYSWNEFLDGKHTIVVEKAVACPDGSLTAFCLQCSQEHEISCEPYDIPTYVRTLDGGKTWGEPVELCPYKGRIYDALFYNGSIYVLMFCNDAVIGFTGNKPEHLYRLYKSDDYGKTFYEASVVGFESAMGRGYGALVFTPNGDLIAYAYNHNDESNMDAAISHDCGKSWSETKKCFLKNRIRNPQVGILDNQFILHGRAGDSAKYATLNQEILHDQAANGGIYGIGFVLYTSADGLNWDDGTVLIKGRSASFYSDNLTITLPDGRQEMLMQYSENYNDYVPGSWSGQVNTMYLKIQTEK